MPSAKKSDRKKGRFKPQDFLHPDVIKTHHDDTAQTRCGHCQIHILGNGSSLEINVPGTPQTIGLLIRETIYRERSFSDDSNDDGSVLQPFFIAQGR